MNNGAINILAQGFVWTYVCISLGYTPRSGIAWSYGNYRSNFLRNHQNVSPKQLHQQYMRVPISPYPLQYLSLSFFFFFSHPSKSEVVSPCSFGFIMPNDIEHLLLFILNSQVYSTDIYISFLMPMLCCFS